MKKIIKYQAFELVDVEDTINPPSFEWFSPSESFVLQPVEYNGFLRKVLIDSEESEVSKILSEVAKPGKKYSIIPIITFEK